MRNEIELSSLTSALLVSTVPAGFVVGALLDAVSFGGPIPLVAFVFWGVSVIPDFAQFSCHGCRFIAR
ncbi:MAG: hypothetical protein AB8B84_00360 [Granulosicoccus sp.]